LKKRLFVCLLLGLVGLSSTFASVNYKFDWLSLDPLHKEYFADRTRPDLSVNLLFHLEGAPDRVLQDHYDSTTEQHIVEVFDFSNDSYFDGLMMQYKLGETVSIARSTFTFDSWLSPIAFDLSGQALLQSFYTEGFDDGVGYDGIYFFGTTLRIADVLSMRIGKHHYCSHYGDQIFKAIDKMGATALDEFNFGYKYIRMNSYVIGLSIEPTTSFRVYGELNFIPKDIITVRPTMFAPGWFRDSTANYPEWYNARIVNVGVEYSYPIFRNLGKTTIGYDLHLYEEGKIDYDHVTGGVATFDEDAPWELEHNVKIAQQFNDTTSLEVAYHNGRSPFNNFFFQHTSIISVGLRYNPNTTLNAFDSSL
jgi:hypothetical protein